MSNPFTLKSWSPYVVGAAIGALSWFAFASADQPLGITTAFENTAALAGKAVVPQVEQTNDFYAAKAAEGKPPKINWEWMLVVGVFIGAFLSSWLSGDRTQLKVPELWRWQFGDSTAKRFAAAFFGAALMMFGARLAQGCTSGHGISGALQLAVSSWVFVVVIFAVGIATAFTLFGKEGLAMFDSPEKLALGLLTGIVFGFLLQKGRVAKYHVILGQFLLKDWTVVKIMGTAVLVGAVGVYALIEMGLASLHIKPFLLGGVLIGGVCFGIGMAIFGYCPGTSVAACGEGRRDAMVGVLGMLFGASLFVGLYPYIEPVMKGLGDLGKITLPETLGVSPWLVIGGLVVIGALALVLLERAEHGSRWSLPHRHEQKRTTA